MSDDFQEQLKMAFERHAEFKPVVISRTKINDRRRAKTPRRIKWRAEYYEKNHEMLLEHHREYNASEHGKAVNREYGKSWREKKKEYDKKRKSDWLNKPGVRERQNAKRRARYWKEKLEKQNGKTDGSTDRAFEKKSDPLENAV